MRFDRGSIMAPIGSPTKMTGRDQMSIGGLGGNSNARITGGFMPQSAFDPSALERQIGGLQEQIGNLPSFDSSQFLTQADLPTAFDDRALRDKIGAIEKKYSTGFDELNRNIGNIPGFDDSILRDRLQALEGREIPAFDPSQLEQQIGGLQKQIGNIPSYDDTNIRNMIGNIPQFDDSAIRKMIEDNQRSIGNIPSFDPSNIQSGIAGLTNRLDNLNIPEYKAPDLSGFARIDDLPKFNPKDYRDDFLSIAREGIEMPEYKAPDLSGFARKEDIPSFDRNALRDELFKDITGSIKVPEAPIFDRDALIRDIRSGIDIPKPPSFDRDALIEDIRGGINIPSFDREKLIEDIRGGINIPQAPAFDRNKLIEDIRGGINIPQAPAFDRQKLIEDIRGGINIPQAPDLSAFDTRFADMQKRIDELSQRQAPQPSIPTVEPIMAQPLVPGSGNVPPVQNNGLVRDPYGNMVDPNNLPDNMKLETGPRGTTVRFADDYALQPGDPGYMSNDPGRFNRGIEPIIRPPQVPPKRDDFMSIGGPGGGVLDPRVPGMINEDPISFTPPDTGMLDPNTRIGNYGLDRQFGEVPVNANPAPVQPAPTEPAAVAPTAGADPTQTQMPMGAIDPVLLQQATSETLTDPLLRSLYFGTQDQPGFYQQLQQAGANLIGQDVPLQQTAGLTPLEILAREQAISGIGGFEPFLQQNRDLVDQAIAQSRRAEELQDPYYGRAERQMQIGIGEELGGIGQAREITTGATDRFGGSLGRLGKQAIGSTQEYGGSLGESEDLLRGTLGAYDPGMTQQFYNPYEDAVVQQTIDDVLKAGDKQDIAARAREISSGAFGGSRARLGAEERRQDLGEGLAKALSGIRQTGYSQAQQTGLGEFARQREAERAASSGLAGLSGSRLGSQQQLGSTLRGLTGDQFGAQQQLAANLMGYGAAGSGARQNLATGLLGIGQQRGSGAQQLGSQLAGYGSQIGGIGQTQEQMRAGQRGELSGYGGIGRGIAETGLGRIYQQQLGQQQRPLGVLGQIGSMLPGYQASGTQIDSQYGMPTDPSAAGLGAAFSAYGALAPRQGQT